MPNNVGKPCVGPTWIESPISQDWLQTANVAKNLFQNRTAQGVATVSTRGINQDGVEVSSFERTMLVYRHGHSSEEGANY